MNCWLRGTNDSTCCNALMRNQPQCEFIMHSLGWCVSRRHVLRVTRCWEMRCLSFCSRLIFADNHGPNYLTKCPQGQTYEREANNWTLYYYTITYWWFILWSLFCCNGNSLANDSRNAIFFCICMTYSGALKVQYVSAACIKLFQSIVAVVNYITITFVTYCIAWNDKYIR